MANQVTPIATGTWEERLSLIMDMMKELSLQTDPQQMVRAYGARMREILPSDTRMSLSRRGQSFPDYRITRSTKWREEVNPWKERDKLPHFSGGFLAELLYGNQAVLVDDLALPQDDPAWEYLHDQRSVLAIPLFDRGEALNMVVITRHEPQAFSREQLPELVWLSNLFGRATNNLVLSAQLQQAYADLDHEFQVVGQIQRALLPAELPRISNMDLAAFYQPSQRAGGDYYDFFALPDGRWGIFLADVSGHGSPAAVMMAITHCIAHMHPGPPVSPAEVLAYLNRQLARRYTSVVEAFVTAFYGIYDPRDRSLMYASAGHNPPRLKRCLDGSLKELNAAGGLPLGVLEDAAFDQAQERLQPGDQIVFYTDGITDAFSPDGRQFGTRRLDQALANCTLQAQGLLDTVLRDVSEFVQDRPRDDDQTMIVARIS